MGLDITAYARFTVVPADKVKLDVDGFPTGNVHRFAGPVQRFSKSIIDFTEKAFPGRTAGLPVDTFLQADESFDFRAGSYCGYSSWRDWLAGLTDYGSAKAVWEDPNASGPFVELINFSDCEGVIGPVVAAKLAKDFSDYQEKAEEQASDGPYSYNLEIYRSWRKAFEMAAASGAIEFH